MTPPKPDTNATRAVALGVILCVFATASAATEQEEEDLGDALQRLEEKYERQQRELDLLRKQLAPVSDPNLAGQSGRGLADESTGGDERIEPERRSAAPSAGNEAVLLDEHAVFGRQLTLEGSFTYSHYDRNQLVLSGFLALDTIFAGAISVDSVVSDTYTLNTSMRYGATNRLQLALDLPWIYRTTTYESGGVGFSAQNVAEETVQKAGLGDAMIGFNYQLRPEAGLWPDIVGSLRLRVPTGDHPYGIKVVDLTEQSDPDNEDGDVLRAPESLPTGGGVWGTTLGFSFAYTSDPALLFANIAYTYNFPEYFKDISSTPGQTQPGFVDVGDAFSYGFGIGLAINERTSLSIAYSQQFQEQTRLKPAGASYGDIVGSDVNAAALAFGVTYALTQHLPLVVSVAPGLTTDSPDMTITVKLPYSF